MENYPCNSNDELTSRERYYIENNECVNKIIPTRSHEEYKEHNREWYKSYMKEYNKKYRKENHDKILKQQREHYYANKEKVLQQHKEEHKRNNTKIVCICGTTLLKRSLKYHLTSKKHINFMNNNNNNI